MKNLTVVENVNRIWISVLGLTANALGDGYRLLEDPIMDIGYKVGYKDSDHQYFVRWDLRENCYVEYVHRDYQSLLKNFEQFIPWIVSEIRKRESSDLVSQQPG
jgi:hypothetical protein